MRQMLLAALVAFGMASSTMAQESITLTTPIAAKPAIANYTPGSLTLALVPSPTITVVVFATDGTTATFTYPCSVPCAFTTPAQVATMITTLNTANLTTRSLWRRIFDRLILDFPTRFVGGAAVQ